VGDQNTRKGKRMKDGRRPRFYDSPTVPSHEVFTASEGKKKYPSRTNYANIVKKFHS
jgi:hypothetical protein